MVGGFQSEILCGGPEGIMNHGTYIFRVQPITSHNRQSPKLKHTARCNVIVFHKPDRVWVPIYNISSLDFRSSSVLRDDFQCKSDLNSADLINAWIKNQGPILSLLFLLKL